MCCLYSQKWALAGLSLCPSRAVSLLGSPLTHSLIRLQIYGLTGTYSKAAD